MKNFTKKIIIGCLIGLPMIGNAQFNFTGFPINTYARTTVPMQKVAIGNFPTNASVQAKLHVNQFLLANNPVTDGLMFRTDGSNTISNSWQLYTGATIGSVTEKFRLFVPANSDDVNLQASQNGARMIFGINGPGILGGSAPITRMVITDGAFFGNTGLIGMGNGFLNPQSQLHLNDGVFSTYLQITNFATNASALNPSATDGFKLGIAADGTAEIRQQENLAMDFFTANTERMHINEDNGLTDGFIGMGNGFNNPQSLLHLNNPLNEETWLQITNVDVGESTTDGLRLGILDETPGQPSFGYLRWQEASPFIIQTQNVENQNLNSERIRITTNQGNPDPFNPEGDNTRIGISNRGEEHITLIRSLLHLGYNTGFLINNINATDGWRNWMDVGTFTNNGRENMYVGLKQEAPGIIGLVPHPGARFDAVINWGDNEPVPADGRYNNLRFIYTTPETSTNNQPHTAWNGLETMRIEPTVATTLAAPNFGMVGIGDFSPEGPNTANPDVVNAKLDIDGDLRIRTVTQDNTLTRVLVIDPTDHNRVHWIDGSNLGSGVGNYCSATQNPLTGNYEIPLHDNDFYFQDLSGSGRVFLGDVYCGSGSDSRVYIRNNSSTSGWQNGLSVQSIDPNGIGGYFEGDLYGIKAQSITSNPMSRAGYFVGIAESTSGGILTSDKMFKTNIENIKGATDVLRKLKPHTYKMDVAGFPQFNFQSRLQYGFIAQEVGDVLPDLVHDSYMPSELDSLGNEISPAVSYKSLNYNALIPITVQAVNEITERIDKSTLSDQNVKTNVQNLSNSLDKVKQMRGVSYEWTSSAQNNMNLDSLQHIGFIAQEIAAIEPLLTFVDDSSLVHVNYDRVVPLLVESVKELDGKVQSKDSIIENLETRLAYLENCIRNANICNEGNKTSNQELNNEINQRSIEITNHSSIILDQNLPNPFAENTVINYNIPTDVMEAKLMFYDLNGRIIKELIIEERGESKLTVYGENLKTGVYTYSLIADGELIATKKMVKK